MTKAQFDQYDSTAANNTDVGGVAITPNSSAGLGDDAIRELMSHVADHFAEGTIASASTTDLSTVAAQYVNVTGTTTITAFGTMKAGTIKTLLFAGALTLTHNGTSLILPGGANITTAAGDIAVMVSEGSGNWRCLAYRVAAQATGTVELGAGATDTTLTRSAAGVMAVEGNLVPSPASQAQGDIAVRGASSWSRLAIGTARQVPAVNSGATGLEYVAPGALEFISSADLSNSTYADFTDDDSSKYDGYVYKFANVKVADGENLLMRTTDDTSSWVFDSGATDYYFVFLGQYGGVYENFDAGAGESSIPLAFDVGNGTDEDGVTGHVSVNMPHLNKYTLFDIATKWAADTGAFAHYYGSARAATNICTGVRIFSSGGANGLISGTITKYGYRNS